MHSPRLSLLLGDITTLAVDAIVNAANARLLGGGGVDGAIHAAAGHGLYQECLTLGGCHTGEAKLTGGYQLPAKHVIHTVGPVWCGGRQMEIEMLAQCYRSSLLIAEERGFDTIAFPAISAGVYGFPLDVACATAVNTVLSFLEDHSFPARVMLVAFDPEAFAAFRKALNQASTSRGVHARLG